MIVSEENLKAMMVAAYVAGFKGSGEGVNGEQAAPGTEGRVKKEGEDFARRRLAKLRNEKEPT